MTVTANGDFAVEPSFQDSPVRAALVVERVHVGTKKVGGDHFIFYAIQTNAVPCLIVEFELLLGQKCKEGRVGWTNADHFEGILLGSNSDFEYV